MSKSPLERAKITQSLAQLGADIKRLQQQVVELTAELGDAEPAPARDPLQVLVEHRLGEFLIDNNSEGIVAWDSGLRCTLWNPALEALTGVTRDAMIGKNLADHLPAMLGRARETCRAGILAASPVAVYDQPFHNAASGQTSYFDATFSPIRASDGTLAGGIATIRDTTDRKNAEQALFESERRFRLLVESVTDYAIFMLDSQGLVTNWNSGAQRIKGYRPDEIVGEHFSRFYTVEDREAGLAALALATAEREGKYSGEGWRVRQDGSRFWARVVIEAIRGGDGALMGFVKITRDITERREAQAKLEHAREQLFQGQKIEALGQLTGGVAHDFNNLLTVVIGNLDLLTALCDGKERPLRLIAEAQRAADRGARLTEHLLAYSRRQTLHPESLDANQLLLDFQPLLQRAVGEAIEIDYDLESGLWPCRVDRAQFETAMLNLAVNARDAIVGPGALSITTRNVALTETFDAVAPGDYVMLTILDSGCGMAPDVLARAFEPFFTTKEVGKGSGLGLSMVYGFAEQSGGAIRLESTPGAGTSARLYLPRSGEPAVNETAQIDAAESDDGSPMVLVVEDDEDVRQVAVEILESLGYRVLVAENGIEALTILARDEPIRLLFSDVVMPGGLSGIELAREVRRLHQDIRILLTSGYSAEAIGENGSTDEFTFFRKPYRPAELARKISDLLGEARPASGAEPTRA